MPLNVLALFLLRYFVGVVKNLFHPEMFPVSTAENRVGWFLFEASRHPYRYQPMSVWTVSRRRNRKMKCAKKQTIGGDVAREFLIAILFDFKGRG
jgi:hypothetical protein